MVKLCHLFVLGFVVLLPNITVSQEKSDGNGCRVESAWTIGVTLGEVPEVVSYHVATLRNKTAAIVLGVEPGSAAQRAGLRPNDIILTVNSEQHSTPADYESAIKRSSGRELALSFISGGAEQQLRIRPKLRELARNQVDHLYRDEDQLKERASAYAVAVSVGDWGSRHNAITWGSPFSLARLNGPVFLHGPQIRVALTRCGKDNYSIEAEWICESGRPISLVFDGDLNAAQRTLNVLPPRLVSNLQIVNERPGSVCYGFSFRESEWRAEDSTSILLTVPKKP